MRMHVCALNTKLPFSEQFNIAKSRSDGAVFNIKFMEAAFCQETFSSECVIAFDEYVYINKIKDQLKEMGACGVFFATFAGNDNNESASAALVRVRQLAAGSRDGGYTRGTCDERLNQRTNEKLDAIKQQQQQHEAAELKEKAAADAKLQYDELRGDIAQGTAVSEANSAKLDKVVNGAIVTEASIIVMVKKFDALKESVNQKETLVEDLQDKGMKIQKMAHTIRSTAGRHGAGTRKVNAERDAAIAAKKALTDANTTLVMAAAVDAEKMAAQSNADAEQKKTHKQAVSAVRREKAGLRRELTAEKSINAAKDAIIAGKDTIIAGKDAVIDSKDVINSAQREIIEGLRRELEAANEELGKRKRQDDAAAGI